MIFRSVLTLTLGALLLFWSLSRLRKFSTLALTLQLIGAIGVIGVGSAHLCEALRLFPVMRWGAPHSIGHYLDLASALVAVSFFPIGLLMSRRRVA